MNNALFKYADKIASLDGGGKDRRSVPTKPTELLAGILVGRIKRSAVPARNLLQRSLTFAGRGTTADSARSVLRCVLPELRRCAA